MWSRAGQIAAAVSARCEISVDLRPQRRVLGLIERLLEQRLGRLEAFVMCGDAPEDVERPRASVARGRRRNGLLEQSARALAVSGLLVVLPCIDRAPPRVI